MGKLSSHQWIVITLMMLLVGVFATEQASPVSSSSISQSNDMPTSRQPTDWPFAWDSI